MGIFDNTTIKAESIDVTDEFMDKFCENVLIYEASCLNDDQKTALMESDEFLALEQKGIIGRKTRVSLSKQDDMSRRTGMASIQLAKENNDMLYTQLVKNRIKEKSILSKIDKKYASKAMRIAKASQKSYLKTMPIGIIK